MSKRLHSETLDEIEQMLRDRADALVDGVVRRVCSTPLWIKVQETIDEAWASYAAKEVERRMLFYRFPGGSKAGRKIIRRDFDGAFQVLMKQYFVDEPLYSAALFSRRFRVSRKIFERVYNACLKHPCFQHEKNCAGRQGIHPLVKTTAVFRHIAYGTSADQLDECFQISETTFLETRLAFCDIVLHEFEDEYLPPIDNELAKSLIKMHERIGWPGLLGSLDCSHWQWAKCPKSLHGEYKKGSKEMPTVVYECACDYQLRIWHCNFALPGSCNDLNVLDVSPLVCRIANGKTIADFSVDGTLFQQPYLLVDGIYPKWTCFLGPISVPSYQSERNYTVLQSARRKDIERAFGVLKMKFNILNRPSLTGDISIMNRILRVCTILHNMVKSVNCV